MIPPKAKVLSLGFGNWEHCGASDEEGKQDGRGWCLRLGADSEGALAPTPALTRGLENNLRCPFLLNKCWAFGVARLLARCEVHVHGPGASFFSSPALDFWYPCRKGPHAPTAPGLVFRLV